MSENREQLEGVLDRIVYASHDGNYTVARLKVDNRTDLETVVGSLPGVNVGETISAVGEWVVHKKFGRQFRADSFLTQVPATINGIEKYLGSGLIKGIGPVMAERLTRKFGEDTLDVIEHTPERLTEVEGLGTKKARMITQAWEQQKGIRDVMVFLQGHGISATYAEKIYRVYGGSSISRVKSNPYCLASDISGIGFKAADKVACSLGISPDSPERARAAIIYLLSEAASQGHLFLPLPELSRVAADDLDIDVLVTEREIVELKAQQGVQVEKGMADTESIYLTDNFLAESRSAEKLKRLARERTVLPPLNVDAVIDELEKTNKLQYTPSQKEAVKETLSEGVLIITGGPGTGKTTLIKAIVSVLLRLDMNPVLAAPTGRAAKRLSQATGMPAKTIHRLLAYNPARGGFQRDEENPLVADAVILDETSMLDIPLFNSLINAIPMGTRLILVGDVDQLPSVGPGNFLNDAINAGVFKVVVLKEIFRQAEESLIIKNAHRINQGLGPVYNVEGRGQKDFFFIEAKETTQVLEQIKELCSYRLPRRYGLDNMKDIQVICPMNKGEVGTWNLNLELRNTLNPIGAQITRGERVFRVGDRVMQTRNNYDKDVFNGDLGRIVAVDLEENNVSVFFDGIRKTYDSDELDELILAYAMSVHKSQGSEYPVVIMPLVTQHYPLLQRNLLYTAVSRAQKLVVLVGTKKAMYIAISNDKVQKRHTHFMKRLQYDNS